LAKWNTRKQITAAEDTAPEHRLTPSLSWYHLIALGVGINNQLLQDLNSLAFFIMTSLLLAEIWRSMHKTRGSGLTLPQIKTPARWRGFRGADRCRPGYTRCD
jgi:hypothetical protein